MKTFNVHLVYTAHHVYTIDAESKEEAHQKAMTKASSLDFEYGSLDCDIENDVIDVTED